MKEGLRVLVIDDERPIRRFLRVALGARGYDVQEAETGEGGLATAASFRPDLVVLDDRQRLSREPVFGLRRKLPGGAFEGGQLAFEDPADQRDGDKTE